MKVHREFSMPNSETFSMKPVRELLSRYVNGGVTIDPFARDSKWATHSNDLNPATAAQHHMDAVQFSEMLVEQDVKAEVLLFDPPYSPRQISECYKIAGRKCGTEETQNARLYKSVKDALDKLAAPGTIAICCGWNSMGFGVGRGWELTELLLVTHGAAHNDTIVTVEVKR